MIYKHCWLCSFGCKRLHVASAAGALVMVVALLFVPRAPAQASDVHIVPLTRGAGVSPASVAPASDIVPPALGFKPLRVDVDLVLVPVSVTDAMNRPVTDLKRHNFAIYEGEREQQIRYFSKEDVPISVGVLLDLSKSMSNKIDVAREALGEFFATSNPDDDYFVIGFADRPEVLADSTQSIGSLRAQLASAAPGGHTALLDAIYMGISKLRRSQYHRRALVIISDGGDNHSRYTANEIKSLVEEEDVQIYAIGLFDSIFKTPEEWAGKRLLTQITEATGGRTITLGNTKNLPQAAATVSWELRNQYLLGYRPKEDARDGTWRKIKVRILSSLAAAPLQIHFKKGYLAPVR